jgi:hypothetical protein
VNAEANLKKYLTDRRPHQRYVSFDYCFNYFQGARDGKGVLGANLEQSCLQLGFFLASWGMLRASSVLLRRSLTYYVPVIEAIANADDAIWEIDAHNYSAQTISALIDGCERIRAAFAEPASPILVSKVMLGVYGCMPAFDENFRRGFRGTFCAKSLSRVGAFYRDNVDLVERYRMPTIDFATGKPTRRRYSRAKVIDMIYYVEGDRRG